MTLHRKLSAKVEVLGKETRGSLTFSASQDALSTTVLSALETHSAFFENMRQEVTM